MLFNKYRYEWLIGLVAALFFIPFLGNVHLFDWDEINFAECAREMLINHEYGRVYINFEPFWEKPPLFIWLQALSMQIFGINEFSARFPNALCGIITLVLLYRIGKNLQGQRFGLLWALCYFGSILPQFYFHSGIIDPWFNLFIFLGIYNIVRYTWVYNKTESIHLQKSAWYYLLIGGFFTGLAVITKGPVALLVTGLVFGFYWAYKRFWLFFNFGQMLVYVLVASLCTICWFGYETITNGPWFVTEFITYQIRLFSTPDAGHAGFPGYHFVVLLVGCFPASLFAMRAMGKMPGTPKHQQDFRIWMLILFWVVLILFTIVKSKIVHYSSLCYFPISWLAATAIYEMLNGKITFPRWLKWSILVLGCLIGVAPLVLPWLATHREYLRPLLEKDPFAVANLDAKVHWTGIEWTVGLFAIGVPCGFLAFLNRKQSQNAIITLFGGTACTVLLILWGFIGRIELFSQGAAIRFLEKLAGKDVYVLTFGYRSYAHYFYAQLQPQNKPKYYYPNDHDHGIDQSRDSLLLGNPSKDVYLITKINETEGLARYPKLRKIGSENGFVFYSRPAKTE